jgi:polyisoprenoid-binding protein YceI
MKIMKIGIGSLVRAVAAVALLLPAGAAWAQWELDGAASALNFISIKNEGVAEIHSFATLVGTVSAEGEVELRIDLDSVETLIPIRNERMREMLFETVKFPTATITAAIDPGIIATATAGGTVITDLPVNLSLHGQVQTLTVPLAVVGAGTGRLQVFTLRPVVIKAADFGLEPGVAALQKVAGLAAISTAVPVTFRLVFKAGS